MAIDVDAVRADTPSCAELIHFNNAGASLLAAPIYQAVVDHLALEQRIGGYEAAAAAAGDIENFYPAMAHLLGAKPNEIAAIENATRAWDMACYSIAWREGDRIITHASEYASNYLALLQLRHRFGVEIDLAPSDDHGQIDVAALPDLLTNKTRLIAITHVPSQSGLINPAAAVGQFAAEHGLLYLLDACQSVGQIQVNVRDVGCHFLSGTGRKFLRGPRGTGFLYVAEELIDELDPVFIDLHAARWTSADQYQWIAGARRFENWECYVAGKIGLGMAAEYATELGLAEIESRVTELATSLRERLRGLPDIVVRDHGEQLAGIVTFTRSATTPEALASYLREHNINTSVTPASYAQLDLGQRNLVAVNRASIHYYNTHSEIEQMCSVLASASRALTP